MSCSPSGLFSILLNIISAESQLGNRCCWGKQQENYTQMCGMQKGLTCERDSRGSREHRVCLFLLWASRSTNITDHEQPCKAKTHNTDSSQGTAEIFAILQVLAVNTLLLCIVKRGKGNGAPPVHHYLTQKTLDDELFKGAHFKTAACRTFHLHTTKALAFSRLNAGGCLFVLHNFLKHSVG